MQRKYPESLTSIAGVSVPRRGSADGATQYPDICDHVDRAFQSPEGEVLTVQHAGAGAVAFMDNVSVPRRGSADGATLWARFGAHDALYVSVPRRGSADGATDMETITITVPFFVSVPRRGSADGATEQALPRVAERTAFQSPEGEVLTVQLTSV